MIKLNPKAAAELDALIMHFLLKERLEAAKNLLSALAAAREFIVSTPESGLAAPRPYPALRSLGQ